VTTGLLELLGRAKLQSNHHHQQTNTHFVYRPDALPVAQPTDVKALKVHLAMAVDTLCTVYTDVSSAIDFFIVFLVI